MSGFFEDIRHAWRIYRHSPATSAFAVIALAVGMASIAATFSFLDDLVLRPHPGFPDGDRLVTISQTTGTEFGRLSPLMLDRLAGMMSSLEALSGVNETELTWRNHELVRQVHVELVTHGFSDGLKPSLHLGAHFGPHDHLPGAEPVVILSDRFWRERLAADPRIIGQTITLSGGPQAVAIKPDGTLEAPVDHTLGYRVIGVFSAGLVGTFRSDTDMWMPFEEAGPLFASTGKTLPRSPWLRVVGRLRSGATIGAARQELATRYHPADDPTVGVRPNGRLEVLRGVVTDIGKQKAVRNQVALLLSACALLVLVAAGNISLFMFSQAPRRRRELAVRMAVGAPPARLMRQLITEAGVLVAAAALLGLTLSTWFGVLLRGLPMLRDAEWRTVSVFDWRVLLVVVLAALLVTMLVSLSPVLGIQRSGIASTSRLASARPGVAQWCAESVQITIATILAGVAVAFIWYLIVLDGTDRGIHSSNVYVVDLLIPNPERVFTVKKEEVLIERQHVQEIISALPAVQNVSFGGGVPGLLTSYEARIPSKIGDAREPIAAIVVSADTAYLKMLGIGLLRGDYAKAARSDSVVVNETFARRIWGRLDVTGEVFNLFGAQVQIAGVAKDAMYGHPAEKPAAIIFSPYIRISYEDRILIRSSAPAEQLRRQLQAKVDQGALKLDIRSIRRVDDVWSDVLAPDRARALLTTFLAVLVVALAAFGFYGTQRYLVGAGKREYAIRRSIGADPRSTRLLVLRRGLLLATPGLLFGIPLAFICLQWLREELISVAVPTGGIVVLVAAAVAVLLVAATLGPAQEAATSPLSSTLKDE
ncbi:MAG TPA: ABC transporter permease [Steroidobacteraceae bacterium]|jgi:predicted permease|nr:ABC transporter permease [Steroidobacteraceae bacterium]